MPPDANGLATGDGKTAGVGLSLGTDEAEGEASGEGDPPPGDDDAAGDGVTSGVDEALGLNTVGNDAGAAGVTLGSGCGEAVGADVGISAVPTP